MEFRKISKEQYLKDVDENLSYYETIKLPCRATKKSAAYDIFAIKDLTIRCGQTLKIPTGIKAFLDDDKFLMIVPRSGLGCKYRLQLDNTIGVIDADYIDSDNEGHIWLSLTNDANINNFKGEDRTIYIKAGQAVAQGIICHYFKVDNDTTTTLRNGGFGSTTK